MDHRLGNCFLLVVGIVCLGAAAVHGADLGTAFTYQGRLAKDGTPVTSLAPHCDFIFGLWDQQGPGGNQKGNSPQAVNDVEVIDGLFTVTIDFGSAAIDGTGCWLEITVQCPGDPMATTLAPRVELKPAPYALALPGLYTQQNAISPNLIGGSPRNSVATGVEGGTIGGGGAAGYENSVNGDLGTVAGGISNKVMAPGGFIGGSTVTIGSAIRWICDQSLNPCGSCSGGADDGALCYLNDQCQSGTCAQDPGRCASPDTCVDGALFVFIGNRVYGDAGVVTGGSAGVAGTPDDPFDSFGATVGGGLGNLAREGRSTVGGGSSNVAAAVWSTVAGGRRNRVYADYGTVPGGYLNEAGGKFSFAAGSYAVVRSATAVGGGDLDGDEGTFVWADSTPEDFTSTGPNQFLIRSTGGMRLATGNGSTPQFQAILPSTDTPTSLAINPLGGVVSVGTSAPDPAYQFYVNGGAGFAVPGGGVVSVGTPGGVPGLTALAENGHRRDIRFRDTTLSLLTSADGTTPSLTNGVVIDESGRAGIGRSPATNRLEVEGEASKTTPGSWVANSDQAIKANIRGITNALETILKLRPVAYRYTDEYKSKHRSIKDQDYYNYIAQEFREVFPEWVQDSGENGLLQMDSYPASVYSVAAIQELHQIVKEKDCEINELIERDREKDHRVAELEQRNAELEVRLARLEALLLTVSRKGERP